MGKQRHGQAEHEHRTFVLAAQGLPLDIRRVHRQRIVGKGAAIEPCHQQQGQDQRKAGDDPERQRQQPAGNEQNRGKNAVDRSRRETVLTHRRHVAVIGCRQLFEHQRHDDDGGEQRSSQVGAGENRHPGASVSQHGGQPSDAPANQEGHRRMAEQPFHQ